MSNLTDKERALLDAATGYLMRSSEAKDRKPLKYIADLIILVKQLDNRITELRKVMTCEQKKALAQLWFQHGYYCAGGDVQDGHCDEAFAAVWGKDEWNEEKGERDESS